MSAFILLWSALLSILARSQVVTVTGYIVDLWCWDDNNFRALDTNTLLTVDPSDHSVHCIYEVPFCNKSGFAIVNKPTGDPNELYDIQYLLDDAGNNAARTAMSKVPPSQKGFEFTWTGVPDTATTDDCDPDTNRVDWYCAGRPILRTQSVTPSTTSAADSSCCTNIVTGSKWITKCPKQMSQQNCQQFTNKKGKAQCVWMACSEIGVCEWNGIKGDATKRAKQCGKLTTMSDCQGNNNCDWIGGIMSKLSIKQNSMIIKNNQSSILYILILAVSLLFGIGILYIIYSCLGNKDINKLNKTDDITPLLLTNNSI